MLYFRLRQFVRTKTDVIMRSVLKNSGWVMCAQATNAFAMFGETLILARFLGVEKFGVFILLMSVADLVFGLLDFRTGEAVTKFLPEFKRKHGIGGVSEFLLLIFVIDSIVAGLGLLVIFLLAWAPPTILSLPSGYTWPLMILGMGGAGKALVRSVGSYLRVSNAFPLATMLGIAATLFRLLTVAITLIIVPDIFTASIAVAMGEFVFFLLLGTAAIVSFRKHGIQPLTAKPRFLKNQHKSVVAFLFNTNLASTVRILSTKLDVFILAALSSPAVVALYKVASRLAGTVLLFSDPMISAFYPEISKLHAANALSSLRRVLRTLTSILAFFALLTITVFILTGKWLLVNFIGQEFVEAYPSMLIMLIGTAFSMIFFWVRPLLLVYSQTGKLLTIAVISLIVQLISLFLFVPQLGGQGAAFAFMLSYLITPALSIYVLKRYEQSRQMAIHAAKVSNSYRMKPEMLKNAVES